MMNLNFSGRDMDEIKNQIRSFAETELSLKSSPEVTDVDRVLRATIARLENQIQQQDIWITEAIKFFQYIDSFITFRNATKESIENLMKGPNI